jgi:hypothetical protein
MAAKIAPRMAAVRLANCMRMIIAGIEAIDHFTRIITIHQNGTSMSRRVTEFPSVMAFPICLRR